MSEPTASIIIPAHNEAGVIGRTLTYLLSGAHPGEFDIIVAANGCTDVTADAAKAFGPGVRVVEVAEASKIAALNTADAMALDAPRVYLDADIQVSAESLRKLVALLTLSDGPMVAAPALKVDLSESSWAVRANFGIWELTDYRKTEMIGSGIYALSVKGRQRFGEFPDIIADDLFIQQMFPPTERAVSDGTFTVKAPRTIAHQIQRSVRVTAGNRQLARSDIDGSAVATNTRRHLVKRVLRTPKHWPAFAVYCYTYLVAQRKAEKKIRRGEFHVWERDESTRV